MSVYSITIARSVQKELESLNHPMVKKIFTKLESLAQHPRPVGSVKLQGHNDLWRIRVGDYRVIYSIDDHRRSVDINRIRHRKDAYK